MQTIAIISDIHANLPALEAVVDDLDTRAPEAPIYHLGDLVGYAPWPNETVALLEALPFRLDLRPQGGHQPGRRIILIHGNPDLNTVYWTEDRDDSFCLKMAERAGARPQDIVVFGHTHIPWDKEIEGIRFINAGSVGRPKDGDRRACYLRLHLGGSKVDAELVRVEYDIEESVRGIEASTLPDDFGDYLRNGGRLT